jgi:uncharacterized membrane protein
MKRGVLKRIPLRANPFLGWGERISRVFFGLFLIEAALDWTRLWLVPGLLGSARWPEGVLVVLAAATTVASLARRLPAQNVMLALAIVAFIGGAVQSLGALTGIPFGPYLYNYQNIGQVLFPPLPWAVPLVWIVAVLNSRGVARLMLRPWRKTRAYGFWVIGLATVLVVLFDFGLEPFATRVKGYWYWAPTKLPFAWYGAPFVNFLGWAVATLLILAFATPSLIDKKKVRHPPDYHPLVIWLVLDVLFATAAMAHQLWPAAALIVAACIIATIFAVRGAKW